MRHHENLWSNRGIRNITWLGGENSQFWHNRVSNVSLGMKNLQNEITGIQTIFSTNFGNKLTFILSFLFPECVHCCYIYFHCSYLYKYYNCSQTIRIKWWVSYWDLIKFPCYRVTTEIGDRGERENVKSACDFPPLVCLLSRSYLLKTCGWYVGTFCTHNLSCYEYCKGHTTCSMTCYRPLISKTCITWTQIVFRYQKVKTNGAKGKLRKKITTILFVLTTLTISGQFNMFQVKPGPKTGWNDFTNNSNTSYEI
jgi:hypothetical protein